MTFSDPASPQFPSEPLAPETASTPEVILSPRDIENANAPADVRVPWGWLEVALFLVFAIFSFVVISACAGVYLLVRFHMTPEQFQQFAAKSAPLNISIEVIWSALLLAFLVMMIRVYHGKRFWFSIGWRKLRRIGGTGTATLACVATGAGLALAVGILTPFVQTNTHVPMEDLFTSRTGVLWLTCYGILFAPFWEETMFRGFLYPVFARRWGVPAGILVTGLLFGALHAAQLWGGWGQIALLTFVGIVLTWTRARAGTVAASFVVHVTYNTILFGFFFIGTHWLHQLPPVR